MEEVTISKLVHGGQGLGALADGRKVFVWNALPGEVVRVRVLKKKRSYAEAIAEEIIIPSPDRVEPREANYLATSPWQIINPAVENEHKVEIVRELFASFHIDVSMFNLSAASGKAVGAGGTTLSEDVSYGYRNKMEYSFWGDEAGLHLALHQRGSHGKQIVQGSALALPAVDLGANTVLHELQRLKIRAGDLKTVVVRANQKGESVAALFVKPGEFPRLKLPSQVKSLRTEDGRSSRLKGLRVYHSTPKSPASVRTKLLYEIGDCGLEDVLLGKTFYYDVDSFFQVNLPVYEQVLARIKTVCQADPVDMYAGVGTIGLSVANRSTVLVEVDPATAKMARKNISYMIAPGSNPAAGVVEASTERALEFITSDRPVIFDPPRAGLHAKVVERCLEVLPPQITYLSCNPATHARDLALLQLSYRIALLEVYNFFPRTPHIETLAVLEKR